MPETRTVLRRTSTASSKSPSSRSSDARRAFADYADVRARMSVLTWNQKDERIAMQARVLELQDGLWRQAAEASQQAPNPATTGLYVQSLNEMIDAYSSYMAELLRHVPHLVTLLLFAAFIVSGGMIGYSAGLAGDRPARATYLMVCVVVFLMYMVMDLDRPHRGIIQVSSQSLLDLKKDLALLRRVVAPERDAVNVLLRRDPPILDPARIFYFQDIYDHLIRIADSIDTYRELATGTLDAFLSVQNNKLSEVVRKLTILSTAFLPLMLVTSFFGMNFAKLSQATNGVFWNGMVFMMAFELATLWFLWWWGILGRRRRG